MGTHFKKSIFDDHVQVGLVGWAQKVKKKRGLKGIITESSHGSSTAGGSSTGAAAAAVQMGEIERKESGGS